MSQKSKSIPRAIGIALILLVVIGGIYVVTVVVPRENVRTTGNAAGSIIDKLATAANEIFGCKVLVHQRTTLHGQQEIRELALESSEFTEKYSYSTSWGGSTKELEVEANFRAKAGFDLEEPMILRFDEARKVLEAKLPNAKLLSVEMIPGSFKVLKDEDGWWNKVSPEERQNAQNQLLANARAAAMESGILQRTKERGLEELRKLSKDLAPEVEENPDLEEPSPSQTSGSVVSR